MPSPSKANLIVPSTDKNQRNITLAIGSQTMMIIRKASPQDAANIVTFMLLAMGDIVYKFINEINYGEAKRFLLKFVQQEDNQYSWQNCWVAEMDKEVVAAANVYDGKKLNELRQPVIEEIQTKYNSSFSPEDETGAGEYYIDTLAVDPKYQRQGIGSVMLNFLVDEYVNKQGQTLGLLVEEDNDVAKRLYEKAGFTPVHKRIVFGKNIQHWQTAKQ